MGIQIGTVKNTSPHNNYEQIYFNAIQTFITGENMRPIYILDVNEQIIRVEEEPENKMEGEYFEEGDRSIDDPTYQMMLLILEDIILEKVRDREYSKEELYYQLLDRKMEVEEASKYINIL